MILKFFKTSSTFQLSRYFSIASLITIIVAALVLSWMYRVLAVDDLVQQGEKHHITLTQTFSNAIWPQVKFFIDSDKKSTLPGSSRYDNQLHFKTLDASIVKLLKNTPVLKIKIFDLQGRTVYATDSNEVGQLMPEDYPGSDAVATGKATTKLTFVEKINTVSGILTNRYILSSYLPVRDPASTEIRAVFEIYADVSETYLKIIDSRNTFALAVIIILALVYTALFLLVRHADQVIRKQAYEREQYLGEIESINKNLDNNAKALAQAHDKAVEASTYKSQFLANMSHELRTPLNAIIGYSEMLAEDMEESGQEQPAADLNKIQSAGKHLLMVINEILDISKIEAGQINLHLENFDVTEAVQGIASTVAPLARKGNNHFSLDCPDNIGIIHSDVTRFRQILINLLGNACKFTQNGKISLKVRRSGEKDNEHIICTVSDSGIGISQQNIEKIFKPFQQADSSTTREYGGTGLGLTISKRFCEMLGGSIRAESELRTGTHFTVKLPVNAKNNLPATPKPNQHRPTISSALKSTSKPHHRIKRVLFINDKPMSRKHYQRFLEQNGFSVQTAESEAQGLAMGRKNPPDLIALDAQLNSKNSWSVLQALKQEPQLTSIPVIMLPLANEGNMHSALGTDDYLNNPIDWGKMTHTLKKWVRIVKKGLRYD